MAVLLRARESESILAAESAIAEPEKLEEISEKCRYSMNHTCLKTLAPWLSLKRLLLIENQG